VGLITGSNWTYYIVEWSDCRRTRPFDRSSRLCCQRLHRSIRSTEDAKIFLVVQRGWQVRINRRSVTEEVWERQAHGNISSEAVPLDARERSSCTSVYWDPAFPHLKPNKKRSGAKTTCLEAQSWRTVPSPLIFHFKHWSEGTTSQRLLWDLNACAIHQHCVLAAIAFPHVETVEYI